MRKKNKPLKILSFKGLLFVGFRGKTFLKDRVTPQQF